MAATLPGDLFLPQVAMFYAGQAFNDSLQVINDFVSTSADAPIRLLNDPRLMKDLSVQQPKIKRLGTAVISTRDITSNAGTVPQKFTAVNDVGVKVFRKCGPVEWTPDAGRLAGLGGDDFAIAEYMSREWGTQVGEYLALNLQNTVVAALLGMVESMSPTHVISDYDNVVKTNLSPTLIENALDLLQSARNKLTAVIVHSAGQHDMNLDALGRSYFGVGNLALVGDQDRNFLGKRRAMADVALLRTVGGGGNHEYKTLVLGPGCMSVAMTLPLTMYTPFLDTSRETVTWRLRGDIDMELMPNGFAWNLSGGGSNPSDTALATTGNWNSNFTDHKEVLIAEIQHTASRD